MAQEGVDKSRRRMLVAAISVVGGAGAVAVAWPFLRSWWPSARAQAAGAPVEVDVSNIEPGQIIRVEWRGKPVWIVRRTDEMLEALAENESKLRDPNSEVPQQPPYAQNPARAIKPNYLVLVGICTHLGCSPTFRPDVAPADLGAYNKRSFFIESILSINIMLYPIHVHP